MEKPIWRRVSRCVAYGVGTPAHQDVCGMDARVMHSFSCGCCAAVQMEVCMDGQSGVGIWLTVGGVDGCIRGVEEWLTVRQTCPAVRAPLRCRRSCRRAMMSPGFRRHFRSHNGRTASGPSLLRSQPIPSSASTTRQP
eukprot:363864-Chlamydomonas_euryale.AAC.4